MQHQPARENFGILVDDEEIRGYHQLYIHCKG